MSVSAAWCCLSVVVVSVVVSVLIFIFVVAGSWSFITANFKVIIARPLLLLSCRFIIVVICLVEYLRIHIQSSILLLIYLDRPRRFLFYFFTGLNFNSRVSGDWSMSREGWLYFKRLWHFWRLGGFCAGLPHWQLVIWSLLLWDLPLQNMKVTCGQRNVDGGVLGPLVAVHVI